MVKPGSFWATVAVSAAIAPLFPSFGAMAQSYQTALPLSSAERHAVEARLSTILEHADEGEVARFSLPTGRTLDVRSYRKVVRSDGEPCRGYRIDLTGPAGTSAVDGFRCRRSDGRAWVIVEPEIVLSRSGGGAGVPAEVAPVRELARGAQRIEDTVIPLRTQPPVGPGDGVSEPDADTPLVALPSQTLTPPPLPRRAPERPASAAGLAVSQAEDAHFEDNVLTRAGEDEWEAQIIAEQATGPSDDAALTGEARAPASASFLDTVGRAVDGPEAADVQPADDIAARDTGETSIAALPAPAEAPVAQELAAPSEEAELGEAREDAADVPAEGPARVIGSVDPNDASPASDLEADEAVITALRALDYLPADQEVTPQVLAAAVDEYALDERFALPVDTDDLLDRLLDTLDRNDTVLDCDGEDDPFLCFDAG